MAKYDLSIREEELKHKVARDWFSNYDTTQIIDNIDFAVAIQPNGNELFKKTEYLLWAEAKKGNKQNIYDSVVQLIFTIGKGRINEKHLPPKYIGAFDAEKIAFIPYNAIMEVFSQTDFNWNVPPSDHSTKEFLQLKTLVRDALELSSLEDGQEAYKFDYVENRKELKNYISKNFKADSRTNRGMRITQNNFVAVYNQWRKEVMPSIAINFDEAKKDGLLDSAFFLADLMSGKDNFTLLDKLKVLLRKNKYILVNGKNNVGLFNYSEIDFKNDNMQAHKTFWARYQRPPKKEYWDKIVERNDLLVPQDIRERKGSYFTPSIWVEKSQEYLAEVLGDNWQDEYYIWDCCAGTGNLLANLTNKYNIWASTLDSADVHIMHERITSMGQGSNLLDSHIFQFDFLNDKFTELPQALQDVINDEEKRKKLIIFINPPYAEAGNYGKSKAGTSINNLINTTYKQSLGGAANELFALFLIRIYKEIPSCIIAQFSTMKHVIGPNFHSFRQHFRPSFERGFLVPANTFDNVKGQFPIGFFIWDCSKNIVFNSATLDVYNSNGEKIGEKHIKVIPPNKYLNDWITSYKDTKGDAIGYLRIQGNDFQRRNYIYIISVDNKDHTFSITKNNLIVCSIYLSIRQCIEANWLNDRDSYSYPNDNWITDKNFQSDCLAFSFFHGQNKISSDTTTNNWIPFSEQELEAPDKFQSHFMFDFIAGKLAPKTLFDKAENINSLIPNEPIVFTPAAQAVIDAGRKLWYYYMHHKDNELYGAQSINVNASFYDIRRHFQGLDDKGRMNTDSQDETYMALIKDLRAKLKVLAAQIEENVYRYGFLRDSSDMDFPELLEDEPTEFTQPEDKPAKTVKPKSKHKPQQPNNIINYGTVNIYEK